MRRLALLAASTLTLVSASTAAAQEMTTVDILDVPRPENRWGYAPRVRTVAPGTWVTWTNAGQDAHTVTANDGSFDSATLNPSEGFSWYFDQPGTFEYVCALHLWMTGTVVVGDELATPPSGPEDEQAATEALAEDPQ